MNHSIIKELPLDPLSENENQIINGLIASLEEVTRLSSRTIAKPKEMLSRFLKENQVNTKKSNLMTFYLDTAITKFIYQSLSNQQLWAMSMNTRSFLLNALETSLDKLSASNEEQIIISYLLENFLLQTESFLEIYMVFILNTLQSEFIGKITYKKFSKQLKLVGEIEKAKIIINYFENYIYGPKNLIENYWGTLIKSLRDKIAHRDLLRPNFESNEKIVDQILFDWPTIKGLTIERFCQEIETQVFKLIRFSSAVLYECDWPN